MADPRSSPGPAFTVAGMVLALILEGLAGSTWAGSTHPIGGGQEAVDELLVGFRPEVSSAQAEAIYRSLGAEKLEELPRLNVHRIRAVTASPESVERALTSRPEVRFVERNRLVGPPREAEGPYR